MKNKTVLNWGEMSNMDKSKEKLKLGLHKIYIREEIS